MADFRFQTFLRDVVRLCLQSGFSRLLLYDSNLSGDIASIQVEKQHQQQTDAQEYKSYTVIHVLNLLLLQQQLVNVVNLLHLLQLVGREGIVQRILLAYEVAPGLDGPVNVPLVILRTRLVVYQSGKGGDVVVQYRRGYLVYQCDAFVILIGLGIVLKLYQLDIQPEDGIYMRFKQFLYFLDMLVRHCKVLPVHVVQDILHFAVNLEIAPVLPCLGFFGNNRLQRHVHFMQIGQLQAVFTAIAVYLGNTRQYIHLQAGLCLGREIPVSLQERVQCLIRAAGHSVGTSQAVIRRYHPVIAMAEF